MQKYPWTRLISTVQTGDELGIDSVTRLGPISTQPIHQHIHNLNTKLSCG